MLRVQSLEYFLTRLLLVAHGGSIAVVLKEMQLSQWFFCNGVGDPWLARQVHHHTSLWHSMILTIPYRPGIQFGLSL